MAYKKKKDRGWIKLHRSIQKSEIWNTEPANRSSAWVDLLLMVNHEERRLVLRDGSVVIVGAGQCWTSVRSLAAIWRWTQKRTLTYLRLLQGLGMVTLMVTRKGTLLTIVNWAFYQTEGNTNDSTDDSTNDSTNDSTDDSRTRTIKNEKNVNKNNAAPPPTNARGEELE